MKHNVDVEVKSSLEEGVNSLAKEFKRFNDRKRNENIVSAAVSLGYFALIGFIFFISSKDNKKVETKESTCEANPELIREKIKEDQDKKESVE